MQHKKSIFLLCLLIVSSLAWTSASSSLDDEATVEEFVSAEVRSNSSVIDVLPDFLNVRSSVASSMVSNMLYDLSLVVLYDNGTYLEDVDWESIVWGQVDKVGMKRADIGRAGFDADYGTILWYPNGYNIPVCFVYQRFWAKVGDTVHKAFITDNVAKTPFIYESRGVDNLTEWTIGWNGTITYQALDFPVSLAVQGAQYGEEWKLKTNVTAPVDLDDHGIEYLFYVNPALDVERNVKYIRVFFLNGTQQDYDIKLFLDLQTSTIASNIALLNEDKEHISFFNFTDVFSSAQTKLLKITEETLPSGASTYCLHIGATFGALAQGEKLVIDPSTVATTTSVAAVFYSYQHKTFYGKDRFWAWWYNGSGIVYSTSLEGSSWTTPILVKSYSAGAYGGAHFAVWFNDTHVCYAYSDRAATANLTFRMGTAHSNGTITWLDTEQIVIQNGNIYDVNVALDSAGYPWICYDFTSKPYIVKSSWRNGTWSNATGFPYEADTLATHWWVSVVPLTGQKVYFLFNEHATIQLRGKLWNGTAWLSREIITNSSAGIPDSEYEYAFSATADGDDVYVAYLEEDNHNVLLRNRTYSLGTWSSATVASSSYTAGSSAPVLSIYSSTLYCIWSGPTRVYYTSYESGTWTTPTEWFDSAYLQANQMSCYFKASGGKIGIIYVYGSASPYDIRHACLDFEILDGTTAISEPNQRIGFYSGIRHWTFYSNTTHLLYKTSLDAIAWSEATIIRSCTSGDDFSVWWDDTYIHYAVYYDHGLYYRKGTPNTNGTLTWEDTEQTVLNGEAALPYVSVDSSGYPFIAYRLRGGVTENLSTFQETDVEGRLAVTANKVTWVTMERNDDCYLNKSYGGGYFGDFEHFFDLNFSDVEAGLAPNRGFLIAWQLANSTGATRWPNDFIAVQTIQDGANDDRYVIKFSQKSGGVVQFNPSSPIITDLNPIYVWVKRDSTSFVCDVYSTSALRDVAGNGDVAHLTGVGVADTYNSMRLSGSMDAVADPNDHSSGYIENLDLREDYFPYAVKSQYSNGTWLTDSGFPYQLNSTSDITWTPSIIPIGNSNRTYALYARDGKKIVGKLWNSTAWQSEENATSSNIESAQYYSAVNQGINVHVVFLAQISLNVTHISRNSTVWQSENIVFASANSTSAPILSIHVTKLYAFWCGNGSAVGNNHIFYASYVSSWTSETDWINESENLTALDTITCYYESTNQEIMVFYIANSSSPYILRGSLFEIPTATLSVKATDINANVMENVTVGVSNGTLRTIVSASSGFSNFSGQSPANVTVNATLHGVTINASHTYELWYSDATYTINCTAYNFTRGGIIRHVATDANVSGYSYASQRLTMQFSGAVSTYTMVVTVDRPTYLLNVAYDYDTDYDSSYPYLSLTHYANQTIYLDWSNYGDLYINRVDQRLVNLAWLVQKLTMYVNGSSGVSGTLEIYCGSRGNPVDNGGFTSTSYSSVTTLFVGNYTFASQVTCYVDWHIGPTGTGTPPLGGGFDPKSFLVLDFPLQMLPVVVIEVPTELNLTFVFTGANVIFVDEIKLGNYSEWFSLEKDLPIKILKTEDGEQTVILSLTALVPQGTELAEYNVPCELVIRDGSTMHSVFSALTFALVAPMGVPDIMAIMFITLIAVFLAGTFLKVRKGKKWS